MKLTRVRFTVRGMMVAVAVAGAPLGVASQLWHRSAGFAARARAHRREMDSIGLAILRGETDGSYARFAAFAARSGFHERMAAKYDEAARSPWRPVEPDPPEPWSESTPASAAPEAPPDPDLDLPPLPPLP